MLLRFEAPAKEQEWLQAFNLRGCRSDRVGCCILLSVQLITLLRLYAPGSSHGGSMPPSTPVAMAATAALLTIVQLGMATWARPAYARMRPYLLPPLNVARTFMAAHAGRSLLPAGPSSSATWGATAALVLQSGVGAHELATLLFPLPLRTFIPAASALMVALLFTQNAAICAAMGTPRPWLLAQQQPGSCPADGAGVECDAARTPGMAAAVGWLATSAGPSLCEPSLYVAQLLLGLVLPSALLHRRELASRRAFAARHQRRGGGAGAAGSSGAAAGSSDAADTALVLRGERWRGVLTLAYGLAGLVTVLWSGSYNIFVACMHLHTMQVIHFLLS